MIDDSSIDLKFALSEAIASEDNKVRDHAYERVLETIRLLQLKHIDHSSHTSQILNQLNNSMECTAQNITVEFKSKVLDALLAGSYDVTLYFVLNLIIVERTS